MSEQSSIKKDFDALCCHKDYGGIPEDSKCYQELWPVFSLRRQGKYLLLYEEQDEYFPAPDIARMLKQLSYSSGDFSLDVKGIPKPYSSPALVEILKKSLTDALQTLVDKRHYGLDYFGVYYGKDRNCMVCEDYPNGYVPQENGFSDFELEMIIRIGERVVEEKKLYAGNSTRNPALGEFVLDLCPYLPQEWSDNNKYAFLGHYLCEAGFLDFRGRAFVENFKGKLKEDKAGIVRKWIRGYKTMLDNNPSLKASLGER